MGALEDKVMELQVVTWRSSVAMCCVLRGVGGEGGWEGACVRSTAVELCHVSPQSPPSTQAARPLSRLL